MTSKKTKIKPEQVVVYTSQMTGYIDTILRMALHPFATKSKDACFKRRRFNFRVVYCYVSSEGTGRWRYSCLGSDTRNVLYSGNPCPQNIYGMAVGSGGDYDALQWLLDGEE